MSSPDVNDYIFNGKRFNFCEQLREGPLIKNKQTATRLCVLKVSIKNH